MRVVVVWNNDHSGVLNRFGQPCPERYGLRTVENVLTALREFGHDALLCEGDKEMLAALERFMPPDRQGRPTGMVFNMAGLWNSGRMSVHACPGHAGDGRRPLYWVEPARSRAGA